MANYPPIQGHAVGSVNEWNTNLWIQKVYPNEYNYQYALNGGRQVGGQVVDFVIWKPPQPVAVYVNGSYWHNAKTQFKDEMEQHDAEKAGFQVVVLEEAETKTPDGAAAACEKKIRR